MTKGITLKKRGTLYSSNNRKFWTFNQARKYALKLKLKTYREWKAYARGDLPQKGTRPPELPASPNIFYKNKGWQSYGHWLGTGNIASIYKEYYTFEKAKKYALNLKLKSISEWEKHVQFLPRVKGKSTAIVPYCPDITYKIYGWKGWDDFLGNENIESSVRNSDYMPLEKAKKFVQKLKLKSNPQYFKYCRGEFPEKPKPPYNLPAKPQYAYKGKGWNNWGDYLGTKLQSTRLRNRQYWSFERCRTYARKLGLQGVEQW